LIGMAEEDEAVDADEVEVGVATEVADEVVDEVEAVHGPAEILVVDKNEATVIETVDQEVEAGSKNDQSTKKNFLKRSVPVFYRANFSSTVPNPE